MDILTLASLILALGFLSLGLLLHSLQRIEQRRAAATNQEQQNQDESVSAEDREYFENFYCFMLTDGTCRPGFMQPAKQVPDVQTPGGVLPSESRLDDDVPPLEERVHPSKQSRP
ncbi:hypothetical protein [Pseudomonas sp.]|uniref:hypothetical protein n=1 Tax=Pseudomonas sp. TaxID=306 RepID=UPI0028A8C5E4|nr:hypothetical protein [Pseudomonas sp.]